MNQRRRFILNVKAYVEGQPEAFLLTNTEDLSSGGTYVIGHLGVKEGDTLALEFKELEDTTPVLAEVRWVNKWGVSTLRVTGIGVEFKKVSPSQRSQIEQMIAGGISDFSLKEVLEEIRVDQHTDSKPG